MSSQFSTFAIWNKVVLPKMVCFTLILFDKVKKTTLKSNFVISTGQDLTGLAIYRQHYNCI